MYENRSTILNYFSFFVFERKKFLTILPCLILHFFDFFFKFVRILRILYIFGRLYLRLQRDRSSKWTKFVPRSADLYIVTPLDT